MKIILSISCLFFTFYYLAQSNSGIESSSSYFIDKNSSLQIGDLRFENFIPFERGQNVNIGYNENSAVWCLISLKNTQSKTVDTWICIDNNQLDSIQLYNNKSVILIGDRTNKTNTFLSTQAFKIRLKPNEEKKLIVRLKKVVSFMDFTFELRSEQKLVNSSKNSLFLLSFLMGILFLLIFFNIILFIINKQKLYILYIIHTSLTACYIMITSGMAKFFLFPTFLYFSEFRIYTASLWFISISIFIAHFLGINKTQRKKYNTILVLNGINLLIIVITILLISTNNLQFLKLFSILGYFNFIGVIFITLWATFVNYSINKANSLYVIIAFLPNCIWGISVMLKALQIIPKDINTDWLVPISIYEVILFGYILIRNYFDTFQKNNLLNRAIVRQKEFAIASVTNAQIKERSEIANLLHDKFGSQLSYILQLISTKDTILIEQNIKLISTELRDFSHQIMPKSLEDGDLISSIQDQIDFRTNLNTEYSICFSNYDFPSQIDTKLAFNIYLISLEIISNAIKYAKPVEINIEFYGYDDSLVFQYTDDGIGFDNESTSKGFGLTTIESRVISMNGKIEISSKLNEGTLIQIVIPKITRK